MSRKCRGVTGSPIGCANHPAPRRLTCDVHSAEDLYHRVADALESRHSAVAVAHKLMLDLDLADPVQGKLFSLLRDLCYAHEDRQKKEKN